MTGNDDGPKPQVDRFRDVACELEVDEDEAKFEDAMRCLAKVPPAKRDKDDA